MLYCVELATGGSVMPGCDYNSSFFLRLPNQIQKVIVRIPCHLGSPPKHIYAKCDEYNDAIHMKNHDILQQKLGI